MTNLNFSELDNCFRNNDFPSIENDNKGTRFLKLRSMSRKATMADFFDLHDVNYDEIGSRQYFLTAFNLDQIVGSVKILKKKIVEEYKDLLHYVSLIKGKLKKNIKKKEKRE